MPKFKKGDLVRFKSPNSENADFFVKGLNNLEIEDVLSDGYIVYESDKSESWWVDEEELEPNKFNWRKRFEKHGAE